MTTNRVSLPVSIGALVLLLLVGVPVEKAHAAPQLGGSASGANGNLGGDAINLVSTGFLSGTGALAARAETSSHIGLSTADLDTLYKMGQGNVGLGGASSLNDPAITSTVSAQGQTVEATSKVELAGINVGYYSIVSDWLMSDAKASCNAGDPSRPPATSSTTSLGRAYVLDSAGKVIFDRNVGTTRLTVYLGYGPQNCPVSDSSLCPPCSDPTKCFKGAVFFNQVDATSNGAYGHISARPLHVSVAVPGAGSQDVFLAQSQADASCAGPCPSACSK